MSDLFVFGCPAAHGGSSSVVVSGTGSPENFGHHALGMAGSLLGGLMSWAFWSEVNGQLYPGALLMSLIGAVISLVVWPSVVYARGVRPADRA